MHVVVETKGYLAAADGASMTEQERLEVVTAIALNPTIGDIMPGCGGARKVRFRKRGTGKSGGYRVITYYAGQDVPVFLLTVFGKSEKANLRLGERNALAKLTKTLADAL